ncbi:hypothetical protein NVP2117O_41 [Vibrio phage 2.117.O._10N.261.45.E9]|nr:hypothetical protein NVP1117O_41 [Vibrio phage 1.117.O._10N.261.45.E9]AUR95442.1 hypothetical protein NVP1207B_35 [Vibrio phage 1.207.B._10N.222.51.C2]AUS02333.1 hypothetical protein NVP2117O_41 [Vibrio phage 2.117.O._10N.261.45.E9]
MAYETGTASNMIDLLTKLVTFASANGWTVEMDDTDVATGHKEVVLSSTGQDGAYVINAAFRSFNTAVAGGQNIESWVGPLWLGGDWDAQTDTSGYRYICGWPNDMTYYFVVDIDTIKIVLNVDTTWRLAYYGIIDTFTSYGHWPAPLACAADTGTKETLYYDQSTEVTNLLAYYSAGAAARIYEPLRLWRSVNMSWPGNSPDNVWERSRRSANTGDIQMIPIIAIDTAYGSAFGNYRGIYATTGDDYQAGALFDDPDMTTKFLLVNNIFRTDRNDFCIVELS